MAINSTTIKSTYRSLLRETRRLPHIYLRQVLSSCHFKRSKQLPTLYVLRLTHKAAQELRRLQRANEGDKKAFDYVLDVAYGRKGKLKHELMKVFLSNPTQPPPPRIIPAVERSRPPSYSPELATLLTSIHARTLTKPLKETALKRPPTLPLHADPSSEAARLLGPFSRRREVNIRWRYHVEELRKTFFPLELTKQDGENGCSHLRQTGAEELKLLEEVERLAQSSPIDSLRPRREQRGNNDREDAPHSQMEFDTSLPRRFLRRRYRELLSRIPILTPNNKAKFGGDTALSPAAISNHTRALRIGRATDEDIDWILRAETEGGDRSNISKRVSRQ
ncbi:hypothetical protein K439DRAFT_1417219 [Ramaria rubella]|nr:hypothetical protein K439DRAFT_1417219 [Ramaria rubella]